MESTIATINEILFPPFLFAFTFCTLCIFFYAPSNQQQETSELPTRQQPESFTYAETFSQEFDPEPEAQPERQPQLELTQETAVVKTSPQPTLEERLDEVDLDHLKLRPARKIASRLGIAQKVNGQDQPLSWLRKQIKKCLAEADQPQEVANLIRELAS